jgi:uncharacterized protein (TIGR03435 family)
MTKYVLPAQRPHTACLLRAAAFMILIPLVLTEQPAALGAQSAPNQGASAQQPAVPDWQTTAGGRMEFEVASVRQSAPDKSTSGKGNLMPFDGPPPEGSLFSANVPIFVYIVFAYKIVDASQYQALMAQLPRWAQTTQFDIEARSKGTPTRDQLRLMLQSLLKDRFNLKMRVETRQRPVYALVLEKPEQPGPQLKPHIGNVPCVAMPDSQPPDNAGAARPLFCGLDAWRTGDGQLHMRMVNVTMEQVAGLLSGIAAFLGGMDQRPFVDQTGLSGRFDLNLEFMPEKNGPPTDTQPDSGGPTAVGAMEKQLGLKLVKQTGPVQEFVVDHVDMPSEN